MKNLRKILTGIAVSSALIFNTYNSKAQYNSCKNPKKIEAYSEKLGLNNHDGIRFITCKSEEEGIKDLREIIEDSPHEEIWLYLPEYGEWYEAGFNRFLAKRVKDGNDYVTSGLYYDFDYAKSVLKRNPEVKELIFYHNHPLFENIRNALKDTDPISNEEYRRLTDPSFSEETSSDTIIKNFMDDLSVLYGSEFNAGPSKNDLSALAAKKAKFPKQNVISKICSKGGITEYSLTESGIKCYNLTKSLYYLLEERATITRDEDGSISIKNDCIIVNFEPFEKKED